MNQILKYTKIENTITQNGIII